MAILTSIRQKCGKCDESFPIDTITCPHDGTELKTVLIGSLAGTTLGYRYELQEEIGKGGMGVIYKALDRKAPSPELSTVAVKLLLNNAKENEVVRSRFTVEARAARSLNHPHIVRVHEHSFTAEGLPFMVMDWLPGPTLDDLIEGGQVDIHLALKLVIQLCDALSHAHLHNIVHRDIKPSNIIVVEDSGEHKAILVDFGIAKIFTQPGKTSMHLTQTGQIFGSPLYMSPEQCMGQKLDSRADIYALGCVLYECVTGSSPFNGENVLSVIFKHINEDPPEFANSRKEKKLEAIVFKSLAKKADERYQTMADFMKDLEGYSRSLRKSSYAAPEAELGEGEPIEAADSLEDIGVRKLKYYKDAAEAGDASAQLELALFYRDGTLVEQNNELAFEWCLKGATQGHVDAMANLAEMYFLGDVVELDYDKAYFWFHKAALQDHPACARLVAHMIESKKVEEGDFAEALKWYKRAASLENIEAQNYLGYLYFNGENVEQDFEEAIKWLTRSANQGDSHAQFLLGTIFEDPNVLIEPELETAAQWFQMSAEQGHPDACRHLAHCFVGGFGVEKDEAEALSWMQEAADLNDMDAMYHLGVWHKQGLHGLQANSKLANKFLREAAKLGEPNAQHLFALQLLSGDGVARNPESAVNWLKRAIRQNHPAATYDLAMLYESGVDVEENRNEFVRLLKKAAELGSPEAQYELGAHFMKNGFTKQARKWWLKAADQDHQQAKEVLLKLGSNEDAEHD